LFAIGAGGLILSSITLPSFTLWSVGIAGLLYFAWRVRQWRQLVPLDRLIVVCGGTVAIVAVSLAIGGLSHKSGDETRMPNTTSTASEKGAVPQSTTSPVAPRFRFAVTELGDLGKGPTVPRAINNAGQVVGLSSTKSGEQHAFLWQASTGMRDLGTLGGTSSEAMGINNKGQVVGHSGTGRLYQAVELVNGELKNIDPPKFVGRVNPERGLLQAGYEPSHAFLWDRTGGMRDVGPLIGEREYEGTSEATAINDHGDIVGRSDIHTVAVDVPGDKDYEVSRGFLLQSDGKVQELGNLTAIAINSRKEVAGVIVSAETGMFERAGLWRPDWGLRPIETLNRSSKPR
jgi:probable HAF family extracellular repeat protein